MIDENNKNQQNIEQEQNSNKKNVWLKPNLRTTIFLCLFLLINIIVLCGCAKINGEKNIENMEISDSKNLKENKLDFIGTMKVQREDHSVFAIDDNNILIVGGISKNGKHYINLGERNNVIDVPDTKENNAEIFNLNTKRSRIVGKKFQDFIYTIHKLNNVLLLVAMNENHIMTFDIKKISLKNLIYFFQKII